MYGAKTVSVVFPAYNEGGNIRQAVEDFFLTGVVDEIVVVDNNSRDGSRSTSGLICPHSPRQVWRRWCSMRRSVFSH